MKRMKRKGGEKIKGEADEEEEKEVEEEEGEGNGVQDGDCGLEGANGPRPWGCSFDSHVAVVS